MGLGEILKDESQKAGLVKDCAQLVDQEVAGKSGISGFAVKAGYGAVKGIKPGFITEVIQKLLPHFAEKLDPLWEKGQASGKPVDYFEKNKSEVSEALLSVTDTRIDGAKSGVVKKTYATLRGSAKKNVEEAVPRLARLLEKHTK